MAATDPIRSVGWANRLRILVIARVVLEERVDATTSPQWAHVADLVCRLSGMVSFAMMLMLGFAGCKQLDSQESRYEGYQQALEEGAIERGWVPSFLPESATDIRERHDIDTNETWIRFHLEPPQFEPPDGSCVETPASEVKLPGPKSRGIAWWPGDLVGSTVSAELRYYRCDKKVEFSGQSTIKKAFLAIATKKSEAYYWIIS